MNMYARANRFFTDEERERIVQTTKAMECRTVGEIAVMVVDHSSQYREAEILGAICTGSLMSAIITALVFHSSMWFFIPLAFILFFPSLLVFKNIPVLKIVFVGRKRKEQAVHERAVRAFFEKGLYKTRANTGVLFFLSLLERTVWVLADKGIYEKIDQETLNGFANIISQGVREGRAADALINAMKELGDLLAHHYPITPGDINELPDEILCEDIKEQ